MVSNEVLISKMILIIGENRNLYFLFLILFVYLFNMKNVWEIDLFINFKIEKNQ